MRRSEQLGGAEVQPRCGYDGCEATTVTGQQASLPLDSCHSPWYSGVSPLPTTILQSYDFTKHEFFHGAAVVMDEGDENECTDNPTPYDGADARYVNVANERAFSALQLRGEGPTGDHDFLNDTRFGVISPFFTPQQPQQQPAQRNSVTTATLTPVRTSLSGTPNLPHAQTPLHSTSYGSSCYNRMLSNALLGGSEGRTSVFSVPPVHAIPPAKTQRTGPCIVLGDAAAAITTRDARATDEMMPATVSAAVAAQAAKTEVQTKNKSMRYGATETVDGHKKCLPYSTNDCLDSSVTSLASSPHPLTFRDSKEEEEDDEENTGNALIHTQHFHTGDHEPHEQRFSGSGSHGFPITSPNDRTPSVISPVSYFQHAPSLWTGTNSPTLRLRFQESNDSAVIFEGTGDAIHSASVWQDSLTRSPQPMRTPGIVPHFSTPVMLERHPQELRKSNPPLYPDATSGQYDTLLLDSRSLMLQMERRVHGSCTPPSLRDLSTENDDAPTSPLRLPGSTARHPGFCTPLTSRMTFVLPASTTRVTSAVKHRTTGTKGDPRNSSDYHIDDKNKNSVDAHCATQTPCDYSEDSPTPVQSVERGKESIQCDVPDLGSTPMRSLFTVPHSMGGGFGGAGATERSPALDSNAARYPFRTSPASMRRSMTPSYVLTTPVQQQDNLMHNLNSNNRSLSVGGSGGGFLPRGSSGPVSAPPFPTSPTSCIPVSPIGAMTPVFPPSACQTTRYGSATAAAAATPVTTSTPTAVAAESVAGRVHTISSYRGAPLSIPRTVAVAAHSAALRRSSTSRRDTFHFVRAMTASETSTNPLHSPFCWGCFGVLVAQGTEVWCVGKAQPFCIYPQDAHGTTRTRDGVSTITAVASTTLLPAATWEEASMAQDTPTPVETAALPSATQPIKSFAHDIVYLAVGTNTGDVSVYAYGKCTACTPGAVAVIFSEPQRLSPLQPPPPHQTSTYAVKLQQYGTLRRADRTGEDGTRTPMGNTYSSCTPPVPRENDGVESERHAISVLRVVGPLLYIGDQSGHVSRYDLRHTFFLHPLAADSAAVAVASSSSQTTARTALEGASTQAGVVAPLNPCMPVHHFSRPVATTPRTKAAASRTPVTSPTSTASQQSSSCLHLAVLTGEPVYNLEITENNSYLAVGTQTRLLVYRTADMPRVLDETTASTPAMAAVNAVSSARQQTRNHFAIGDAQASALLSETPATTRRSVVETSIEATTPLVVMSDAPQPVRCFAWMLCDYEALIGTESGRACGEDVQATPIGTDDLFDCDIAGSAVVGVSASISTALSLSSFLHTPTPSLVFAAARFDDTEATVEGGEDSTAAPPQLKTDIQLYRVVTQSIVASCTLDYPVHVLKVVTGTTQIIVGTGSVAEWPHPQQQRSSSSPSLSASLPLNQTPQRHPSQTLVMTPTPIPLAHPAGLSRSRSAMLMTPSAAASPTLFHSPVPVSVGRRHLHAAAAVNVALRTLAGGEARPSLGLWRTPHTSVTTPLRSTTPSGNSAVWFNSGAQHIGTTPERSTTMQRSRTRRTGDGRERHGYLFKFEVCPHSADDAAYAEGDGCVCLRSKGEIVVGEGESAVSGWLSPMQDQVSVLVQPAAESLRHVGVGSAASVKVKVWNLTKDCRGGPSGLSVRPLPARPAATLGAITPTAESLR